jgi:hypothetical protein
VECLIIATVWALSRKSGSSAVGQIARLAVLDSDLRGMQPMKCFLMENFLVRLVGCVVARDTLFQYVA